MDKTLDYPHIYIRMNGKGKTGGIGGLLKKMGYRETDDNIHTDSRKTVNIMPIQLDLTPPILIYKTLEEAREKGDFDNVLVLQLPGHKAWHSRSLYAHYESIQSYLKEQKIRHYCPNPPKDLRKSRRACMN